LATWFDRDALFAALEGDDVTVLALGGEATFDQALEDPEPREPAEEESDGESAEPVGPNWRCAKCGEENPGNFDECWKCETERESTQ